MRSMFFKLFFWFWLGMTLSGMVIFLMTFNMRLGPLHERLEKHFNSERTRIFDQALVLYGLNAANAFELTGAPPANHVRDPKTPPGMHAYLFTADGAPISCNVPPRLGKFVRIAAFRKGHGSLVKKDMAIAAVRFTSTGGRIYIAAAEPMFPSPPPAPPDRFPSPHDFWFRFCVTFVIGGLVCYGLAWHLTSPVRRLRTATQRLATGDLSTRVEIDGTGSGGEVSDLVRDFNRMAERIEKLVMARKRLVQDISHELRSPLARLNVALGLARKGTPPEAAGSLDRIEKESERLNELIGELLDLSLMDSGSVQCGKEQVNLTALVEEVARDADFEAVSRNRRVVRMDAPSVTLPGNRELLRRALENVVRNAVRYTDEGTAVELHLSLDASDAAVIRVTDHGPGVPEDALADIFRPFFRMAEARDRSTGGTGLGLAITERAVRLHGGVVTARNIDGGLEVQITLPGASKE